MSNEDEFSPEVLRAFAEAQALPMSDLAPPDQFITVHCPGESDEDVRERQEVINALFAQPPGFPDRL